MVLSSSSKTLVAWNTTAQIIGKCVTGLVTFLFSILIARSFGASGYGDFTKITTYVAFFYLLSDFGINAMYLQKEKDNPPSLWGVLFGLRLVASIVLLFIALSLLAFLPHGTTDGYTNLVRLGIIFFVPTIIFQSIITTANATFQKHLRYDLATLAVSAGSLLSLVLLLVFTQILQVHVGAFASIFALLCGSIVSAGVSLFFVQKSGTPISPIFDRHQMKKLFMASLPLGLTLVFNVVYFRIDSIILTLTRTTAEVGLYGFAYKFFELPLVIPTFFMNAVYPLMLKASSIKQQATNDKQETGERFIHLIKKSFFVLLGTSLIVMLAILLLSPLVILIRPEFVGSIGVLRVLALGLPFFFLSSLTMWALIAQGQQVSLVAIYGVSMIATLVLDVLFIPTNGIIAASWITVLSEALILIISGGVLLRQMQKRGSL